MSIPIRYEEKEEERGEEDRSHGEHI